MVAVVQQPKQFTPAYNDMIYVVNSTNHTQTNFKFLASIYIEGDVITLKASVDPTYNTGVFNFGRIVESYVSQSIDLNGFTSGFATNDNSKTSFYVKFGEEYGASSGVIQYTNLLQSETRYVWNGIVDYLPFQSYNDTGYLIDNTNRTLNSSGTQYIQTGQDAWQYYVVKEPTTVTEATILTISATGSLIQSATIANPYQTSGTIAHHFIRFACGTNNLNLATLATGTQPLITSSVASYQVILRAGGTYIYNIVDADCKYPTYRLHYMNALGAFDSVNFTKISRKSVDIKKEKFKSIPNGLTSATAYGYSKSALIDRTFYTELGDSVKISTDWLSDATFAQLEELVTSPRIYVHDATHGEVAVTIASSSFDIKTSLNDKLIRLELNINYGYNRYRQRF